MNIIISNEGKIKIFDHNLLNPYECGINKNIYFKDQCYLAPEELEQMKKN